MLWKNDVPSVSVNMLILNIHLDTSNVVCEWDCSYAFLPTMRIHFIAIMYLSRILFSQHYIILYYRIILSKKGPPMLIGLIRLYKIGLT